MSGPSISNVLVVLSLLGAVQGILFGVALLAGKQGNTLSNRLLASLVFVISIFLLGAVLRTTGYDLLLPHLSAVHDPFTFLVGPLFFLYLRTLLTGDMSFPRKTLVHFVPFVICLLYLIPYYLQPVSVKVQELNLEHQNPGLGDWYYVRSGLVIITSLVYILWSIVLIRRYIGGVKRVDQRRDAAVMTTIKFLVGAIVLIWVVGVMRYLFDPTSQTNLVVPLLGAMTVYGLGYIYLKNPVLSALPKAAVPRYGQSTLSHDRSQRYLAKLSQLMETEKPYKQGDLSLQVVAEKLDVTPAHLSQTINEHLGQSFSDYINSYRVEEVKKMLVDPSKKHYSLLAIAEEAGFSSKSSFNSVFKRLVNKTPSEYRKSHERSATR
jgi:AraC-like DNA-binding protein